MRIAVLADIHSNLPALEAVRMDVHLMAPDLVFLAGDQINRCPWPNEVMDLIDDEQWPAIYGNHEVVLMELDSPQHAPVFDDRRRFADLWWTLAQLMPEHFAQLQQLPAERRIEIEGAPVLLLTHGLRGNPFEGLPLDNSDEQIAKKIANIEEPVILTAHTHYAMERIIGEQQIYNPGSVGMPYNGDPRAQYLVLDLIGNKWQPIFRRVDYDRSAVRAAFDRLGLFEAYGPVGPLYWQTVATGDPWVSDFQAWVRDQPSIVRADLDHAVELYLSIHGPGKWAFRTT